MFNGCHIGNETTASARRLTKIRRTLFETNLLLAADTFFLYNLRGCKEKISLFADILLLFSDICGIISM